MALDDELEHFWRAPADTPAFKKGSLGGASGEPAKRREIDLSAFAAQDSGPLTASEASRKAAGRAYAALNAMRDAMLNAEAELGRIDAVAGDGDHGRGMVKGIMAASLAAKSIDERGGGAGALLKAAGDSWASKAGGTSGVLWGNAIAAVGASLGDESQEVTRFDVAEAVLAGVQTIKTMGKAELGDKTMLDAMAPFVDALFEGLNDGKSLADAWDKAAAVAKQAALDTAPLRPKLGRARPLADKSVGTPDAGATSFAMAMEAIGTALR
jgi:dihydroxyacetone kinase